MLRPQLDQSRASEFFRYVAHRLGLGKEVGGDALQPEVELFVLWKNGLASVNVLDLPDGLAELLVEMNDEFGAAVVQESKR